MSQVPQRAAPDRLDPEKVAYWYFRLNGFLQIENFVVHPERRGGQRTDADLLAVRFPYRAERLFDDPNDIMADDELIPRDLPRPKTGGHRPIDLLRRSCRQRGEMACIAGS